MRALSVRQPWATRIATARKTIELRSWQTRYRGPVIILAGARPWPRMVPEGPLGVAVCVVDLVDMRPATQEDTDAANVEPPDGWFAWLLANPRQIAEHIPVKGKLGLYRPTGALSAQILDALGS